MAAKLDVIRSAIFPVFSFGGEVLGMGVTRVKSLESVWGRCVRLVTKGEGWCGAAVLIQELGLSYVHASMSAMRARAAGKYPGLRTIIKNLAGTEKPSLWARQAAQWLNREGINVEVESVRTSVEKKRWQLVVSKRSGARAYEEKQYVKTNSYVKHFCTNLAAAGLDNGFKMLVAARCGGLWTAQRAARRGLILPCYEFTCPCCAANTPETLEHLLLSCPVWQAQRVAHLSKVEISSAGPASLAQQVTLLLGGVAGELSALSHWADTHYVHVVCFLQSISVKHHMLVWQHSVVKSQGPYGCGSPPSSSV
jgi:hypothetical protein